PLRNGPSTRRPQGACCRFQKGNAMSCGYKTVTPIHLANALHALDSQTIDGRALRVFFACLALVAVREAARRYRQTRREKPKPLSRYRLAELQRLTNLAPRALKRALRQL